MKTLTMKLILGVISLSIIYFLSSCNDAGIIDPVTQNSQWVRSYGGGNADAMTFMDFSNDGGSIITGYSISSSFGDNDVFAMKLDESGNIVWSNSFGSSANDQATGVTQGSDGYYIVTGQTNSFGATGFDIYVLKIAPNGDIIWSIIYKAPNDDYAAGVIESAEGGYVITGYSNSFGSPGNTDIFLMKISNDGDIQWVKSFGGIENDYATCIRKTTNGYIVGGYTFSYTSTNDAFILNFNTNGTIIWSRIYSGFGDDRIFSVEPSGNDFVAAGYTQSFGLTSEDMFLLKMDNNGFLYIGANGNPRTFGDSALQSDRANYLIPSKDGGFFVTGYVSNAPNSQKLALIKLFGNMEFAWAKRYESTGNDIGNFIRQKNDNYVITGNTFSPGSNDIYSLSVKDDGTTCVGSTNFTPLGGNPNVIEGPVTVIVNDVTTVFQKTPVTSQTGGSGFSTITNCTSR